MASIPKKVVERLIAGIKHFQPILLAAKSRDVGEADTVTIVKDMLADVFGYDKYAEVTSEFQSAEPIAILPLKSTARCRL